MGIFEDKQELDYIYLLVSAVKSKKNIAMKRSERLAESRKVFHKKSKKWVLKRYQKIEKTVADYYKFNSAYEQIADEYKQLLDEFMKEVIKTANIPIQFYDHVIIKMDNKKNQVVISCKRGEHTPAEFIFDLYVVDIERGLIHSTYVREIDEDP